MFEVPEVDEDELVLLAKTGDQEAFAALVRQNAEYVFNLAYRLTKNREEAEDLSQEAFVRVWKALPNFRSEAQFRTWMYRIVTNLCYDRLPKLRRELALIEIDQVIEISSAPDRKPEARLLSREMQAELYEVIDNLPQSYRLLITLRHLQGMSYDEIAEATGQPLGTVKAGIHRARKMLKERIVFYEIQPG
jgi:RNA polymerase sigma-70 factor (ECF subfamily)